MEEEEEVEVGEASMALDLACHCAHCAVGSFSRVANRRSWWHDNKEMCVIYLFSFDSVDSLSNILLKKYYSAEAHT